MAVNSLHDLYLNKLQLTLDAEQQGLQAMGQMAQFVSNPEVKQGFERHRQQTEQQVQRLQQVIQRRGQGAQQGQQCISARALIQEAQQLVQQIQDPDTRDAFLIAAQQAFEHHEIASYGTLRTWAQQMGHTEDAQVLQQTLQEEEQTDKLLTQIAERLVNPQAAQGEREVSRSAQRDQATQGAGRSAGATSGRGTSADAEASR